MKKINRLWGKYKKLPIPAKAGLWFTICGFIQRGISFITVPFFTRMLTTAQYGTVSVYNSWESLLSILCTLNLFYGGFNNGMLDYEDRRKEYVSAIQGLITTMTAAWCVVYLVGRRFWNNLFELSTILILIMFVQILASAALSLWSAKERYEYRYINLVIVTIANAFFSSSLSILTIWLFDRNYGAEVKIITNAAVIALICGCIYINNFRKGRLFYDKEIWKKSFFFNLPLLAHYLSTMVLNQADRIMISKMVGSAEAGIYSVAYSTSMILNIFVTAINNSFAPWLYGRLKEKDYKPAAKVANTMFAGVALILVLLISFAPEVITIMAGSRYAEAVVIIPSVGSSLYFIFMYQIFANVEFYCKKNKFIAYASVMGAALNVVLNYIGIRIFGYIAAGYTTLICYIVFGIAHYCFMKKICNEELNGIKLFNPRPIFLIAFALVSFSIVMTLLYDHILIRYFVLTVVLIVLVAYRKKIFEYAKMLKNK